MATLERRLQGAYEQHVRQLMAEMAQMFGLRPDELWQEAIDFLSLPPEERVAEVEAHRDALLAASFSAADVDDLKRLAAQEP